VCDAQALVSTNALEMGINIGGLDATVSLGMTSTMCSFRQQAGRSGRNGSPSLAVFLAKDRPLDQHYLQHPKEVYNTCESPSPVLSTLTDPPDSAAGGGTHVARGGAVRASPGEPRQSYFDGGAHRPSPLEVLTHARRSVRGWRAGGETICQMHVTCAAKEKPLEMNKEGVLDAVSSPETLRKMAESLMWRGVLKAGIIGDEPTYGLAMPVSVIRSPTLAPVTLTCERHCVRRYELVDASSEPATAVSIRGGSTEKYRLMHQGKQIEEFDEAQAFREIHVGAIWSNSGDTYRVGGPS